MATAAGRESYKKKLGGGGQPLACILLASIAGQEVIPILHCTMLLDDGNLPGSQGGCLLDYALVAGQEQ